MRNFKFKTRKKWRNFKFWLVKKMFPDGSFNFLFDPMHYDLGLFQMTNQKSYKRSDYDFINTTHIKEVLVSQMVPNLVKHLEYEAHQEGDYVICTGELTIAERKVV